MWYFCLYNLIWGKKHKAYEETYYWEKQFYIIRMERGQKTAAQNTTFSMVHGIKEYQFLLYQEKNYVSNNNTWYRARKTRLIWEKKSNL